jgi:hypothetical protein
MKFLSKEEREYQIVLVNLDNDELRREFVEAGQAFEYFGFFWTYPLVHVEMKNRKLIS